MTLIKRHTSRKKSEGLVSQSPPPESDIKLKQSPSLCALHTVVAKHKKFVPTRIFPNKHHYGLLRTITEQSLPSNFFSFRMAPHKPSINGLRVVNHDFGNLGGVNQQKSKKLVVIDSENNQPKSTAGLMVSHVEIIDIRDYGNQLDSAKAGPDGTSSLNSFRREIINSFSKEEVQKLGCVDKSPVKDNHERSLPTLLLYDEEGLRMFERFAHVDEYYVTREEFKILKNTGIQIAEMLLNRWDGAGKTNEDDELHIVELGSGSLQKASILLLSLLHLLKQPGAKIKKVTYYALDVSLSELHRTYSQIPDALVETDLISCKALHGTYDDGLKWLSTAPCIKDKKKCILWLGCAIGNMEDRSDMVSFLKKIATECFNPGDTILIGADGCKRPDKVWSAYNDSKGATREFILNGLKHANRILGGEAFKQGEWEYVGEWNAKEGRHEAFYVAVKDLQIDGNLFDQPGVAIQIRRGERVRVERSHKFDEAETKSLWEKSGFVDGARWGNGSGECNFHMVYKPPFSFPLSPEKYANFPCPTLFEWRELWAAWDTVTLGMVPKSELHSKPIDLRNPNIFYLGHIPTFLDIHISRALGIPILGKERYPDIFRRGIDPDVDNPEMCHNHSEIPETWPELDEILDFVKRLRSRITNLYEQDGNSLQDELFKDGKVIKRALQRVVWMAFEHETMHLETFLYMLIQSDATLPPPGVVKPNFAAEATKPITTFEGIGYEKDQFVKIPEQILNLGMDDPDDHDFSAAADETKFFGWDNEKPCRKAAVHVKPFQAGCRPITVGNYLDFLVKKASSEGKSHLDVQIPTTWSRVSSNKPDILSYYAVRTVFGNVPLAQALHWPIMASYDELSGCAQYYGGRIPTADEVHAIYKYTREIQTGSLKAERVNARRIDAVNGHLCNNGVTESPPVNASGNLEENRKALFWDFTTAPANFYTNVGFRKWCPESVVQEEKVLRGRGQTGGAWEWTSTVFDIREGFIPGRLYPEYSADFFDGKHNVLLGGSWATHPRVAGRSTFVNWFQRNYRYTWGTARIVKDLDA